MKSSEYVTAPTSQTKMNDMRTTSGWGQNAWIALRWTSPAMLANIIWWNLSFYVDLIILMCVLGLIFFFFSEGRWVGRYWRLISHTLAANDITGAGQPAGYFSSIFFHTVWITDVSFIFYARQWLKHAGTDKKISLDNTQWGKKQNKKNNRSFSPHFTFSTQPMTKLSKEACH